MSINVQKDKFKNELGNNTTKLSNLWHFPEVIYIKSIETHNKERLFGLANLYYTVFDISGSKLDIYAV